MNEKNIKDKLYKKVRLSPFINVNSTFKNYLYIFLAIFPQIVMLFLTKSINNLLIIFTAIIACLLSEIIFFIKRKHISFSIMSSILIGTLIGFFLPAGYPIISVFFITFIAMGIIKYSFGDMNVSWINPVVIVVVVCWFIGQFAFSDFLLTKDILATKNPSLSFIQDGTFVIYNFDESLTSYLNDNIFGLFGISVPQGYVSLFWDSQSTIPAFRFSFLTLVVSIILISLDIISLDIPFFFLTTYLLLVKCLSPIFSGGIPLQGDMILALLSSGTLFCAFFILQYFGTTPLSKVGKVLYGIFAGIIAFIFSGPGTSPIGSIVTVLFVNIISPAIQYFENKNNRLKLINLMRKENA